MPVEPLALPRVLAGPILRQCTPTRFVFWMAVREPVRLRIRLEPHKSPSREHGLSPGEPECLLLTAGTRLHYLLIDLRVEPPLPLDCWIGYALMLTLAVRLQDASKTPQPLWCGHADHCNTPA